MLDMILRHATLPDGRTDIDIGIKDGRFAEIRPALAEAAEHEIDVRGRLATPPFVDSHFHLDSTLSLEPGQANRSGTLLEGIALWAERKKTLSVEDVFERAMTLCCWAIAKGTLAIRSHVDISDDRLLAVDALLEVQARIKPWVELQLVAFPQDGYLRNPNAGKNLAAALDKGVSVVGGIPHFERSAAEGARSVTELCALAAKRGLMVDMHCDETDDPLSRHVETLAAETLAHGLTGRVTGSHLASLHSMDNAYAAKLIPLMAEAGLNAVANPLVNATLQGRHDSYPKRRGMTRVKQLLEAGVNVSFGHDCVLDPWYPLGTHDMLDVAHMGLHLDHMTGTGEMRQAFDAVTVNGAKTLGLAGYGLEPGNSADLVVVQAADPVEALRLKPPRLYVIKAGRVISSTPALISHLELGSQRLAFDFSKRPVFGKKQH